MKNNKSKESVVRARVEEDLKNEFEAWCVNNDLSISQVVRFLLRQHLKDSKSHVIRKMIGQERA